MIDGSCYREGRNWKIFVIFGWHCFCVFSPFIYTPLLCAFPSISPPWGSVECGRFQKNQKKSKKQNFEIMKDWRGCFYSLRASDPALLACAFFFKIPVSYSLFSSYNSSSFSAYVFVDIVSFQHIILFFRFFPRFLFPTSLFSQVLCIVLPGHSEWVLVCLCMSHYSLIGYCNEHDHIFSLSIK